MQKGCFYQSGKKKGGRENNPKKIKSATLVDGNLEYFEHQKLAKKNMK